MTTEQDITAQITITATYDDKIIIKVHDKDAGIGFLEMELTREQFVNAAMNRLAQCNVEKATIRGIEHVGMKMEQKPFAFEINDCSRDAMKKYAEENVQHRCPVGWTPDGYFDSQGSFTHKDGKTYANTLIRRWVKKQ
jgi:hypothetical protein